MITQNVTLSNQEGKIQKTEQNFNHGLALLGLSGTGPWFRHDLSCFENDQVKVATSVGAGIGVTQIIYPHFTRKAI